VGFPGGCESLSIAGFGVLGPRFTWHNGREKKGYTQERLDRPYGNLEWCNIFTKAHVEVLVARSSDHAPLFIDCSTMRREGRRKPFRFRYESRWSKKLGPNEIIKRVWKAKGEKRECMAGD
jgi:hypothetical protein